MLLSERDRRQIKAGTLKGSILSHRTTDTFLLIKNPQVFHFIRLQLHLRIVHTLLYITYVIAKDKDKKKNPRRTLSPSGETATDVNSTVLEVTASPLTQFHTCSHWRLLPKTLNRRLLDRTASTVFKSALRVPRDRAVTIETIR